MIRLPQIGLIFNDGDEWEIFCQSCLKIKHQHNNFLSVPADSGGDYGLDGYNCIGDAYQCYCPEKEYTDKELYEHQRDKITKDIQKLNTYKDKLASILNGNKIKTWHFTTPLVKSKELILHCNDKTNLVKSWNLDFIDPDFQIALKDYEYFLPEIPFVVNSEKILKPDSYKGIDFVSTEPSQQTVEEFKETYENNTFVQNGLRKNAKLFPKSDNQDYSENIIKLTDRNIENKFIGEGILKFWSNSYDQQYEKFVRITKALERKIKDESLIPVDSNSEKLKEIKAIVKQTLDKEFPNFLSEANKEELTSYLVSYWILECSLDFS